MWRPITCQSPSIRRNWIKVDCTDPSVRPFSSPLQGIEADDVPDLDQRDGGVDIAEDIQTRDLDPDQGRLDAIAGVGELLQQIADVSDFDGAGVALEMTQIEGRIRPGQSTEIASNRFFDGGVVPPGWAPSVPQPNPATTRMAAAIAVILLLRTCFIETSTQ